MLDSLDAFERFDRNAPGDDPLELAPRIHGIAAPVRAK
jgi:hypothetical protein